MPVRWYLGRIPSVGSGFRLVGVGRLGLWSVHLGIRCSLDSSPSHNRVVLASLQE